MPKKPSRSPRSRAKRLRSVSPGTPGPRTIELHRRALARKVVQDRRERIRAFKTRLKAFRAVATEVGPSPLVLLAEGDSWFDYPIPGTGGVITQLTSLVPDAHVLNLAHYGDPAQAMLGVAQRQRLAEQLTDAARGGRPFDALLFSGGGNDLAGDQFCLWLQDSQVVGGAVAQGLDLGRLNAILGVVEGCYRDLIAIRDACSPDTVLFLHGYDFAPPTGQGVCGIGPWLKPSLDYRGWTRPVDQFSIVRAMLASFDSRLASLAASQPGRVVHVRTQGTLDPTADWANELHPNREGFIKIAQVFRTALAARFPGRVR